MSSQTQTKLTETQKDKILGLIFGQALGDAYGLSTEFMTKEEVEKVYKDQTISFENYVRNRHNSRWTQCDWTDDTDQMICIMESFSSKGKVSHKDFAKRLYKWHKHGFKEFDDDCGMGIGALTYEVLNDPEFFKTPHEVAKKMFIKLNSEANGALMRTAIVGCIDHNDKKTVYQNTLTYAGVTHYGPLAQASCIYLTNIISNILQSEFVSKDDIEKFKNEALVLAKSFLDSRNATSFQLEEFSHYTKDLNLSDVSWDDKKLGYTLYCLQAFIYALNSNVQNEVDFKNILHELIRYGGDADTNGAVAGACLGCILGYKNLPQDWLQCLPYGDLLMKKSKKFIESLEC